MMKKNIFLLYIVLLFSNISKAQLPSLLPHVLLSAHAISAGVKRLGEDRLLFKKFHFDNSYSIIGLCYNCDSVYKYNLFSFRACGTSQLTSIKERWVINKHSDLNFDKNGYKIFVVKNKQVVENFDVYPSLSNIVAQGEYYCFDTSLIMEASAKFPLEYRASIDSFKTVNEYKNFYARVKTYSSFLFLIEPAVGFEGSFEVEVDKKALLASKDDIISKLNNYCFKIDKNSASRVFMKNHAGKPDDSPVFLIKSDKAFYDRFNSTDFIKLDWIPNKLIVQSFWIK